MDENIRVRTIKEQIRRLVFGVFLGMFVPGNLYAHETMFDQCHQGHPLHKNDNANIVYPVSIFKTAPIYPNRELNRGREGSVIVEYTITKDGGVTDIKILSSTSSAFSAAAKQAVKKFKYEPATVNGKPIDQEGWKHKITFDLDGGNSGIFMESETLEFDAVALTKAINKLPKKPQKAIQKINDLLSKDKNNFHLAVLHYILSSKYYQLDPAMAQERLLSLNESMLALEKLNQNEINVINLKSMNINATSFILLEQGKNEEALNLLKPFLIAAWKNNFHRPEIIYDITINYAIAAYNSGDYCSAFYGFDRSIKQGKALSINNPNLEGYKKAARNNMAP